MKRTRIAINLDANGRGTVAIDGHDISDAVTGLAINSTSGDIAELTLDLVAVEMEVNGEVLTYLPGSTHDALTAAGWTPPAGAS